MYSPVSTSLGIGPTLGEITGELFDAEDNDAFAGMPLRPMSSVSRESKDRIPDKNPPRMLDVKRGPTPRLTTSNIPKNIPKSTFDTLNIQNIFSYNFANIFKKNLKLIKAIRTRTFQCIHDYHRHVFVIER